VGSGRGFDGLEWVAEPTCCYLPVTRRAYRGRGTTISGESGTIVTKRSTSSRSFR